MRRLRGAILVSGRGSNMEALIDARTGVEFVVVISDREDVPAAEKAASRGMETLVISEEDGIIEALEERDIGIICLAGFMRILSPGFIEEYEGMILNIHPSLLPAFPGLNAQRRAIEAGARITGATVHFVTSEVDAGPIILQSPVPVLDDDDEESLSMRILAEEHRLYPRALRLITEERIEFPHPGGRVRILPPSKE